MTDLESRLTDTLDGWADTAVAVRIVTAGDELLAVFSGTLRSRSGEVHPPLFWPVDAHDQSVRMVERRGIYVHPDLLTAVRVHAGGFVVEYVQAGVSVNLRRLEVRQG